EEPRRSRQAARGVEQMARSLDIDCVCQVWLLLAARRKHVGQVNNRLLILHYPRQGLRLADIALDKLDFARESPGRARVSRAVRHKATNLVPLAQQFVQGRHTEIPEGACQQNPHDSKRSS